MAQMQITICLEPETYRALERMAKRLGLTASQFMRDSLQTLAQKETAGAAV